MLFHLSPKVQTQRRVSKLRVRLTKDICYYGGEVKIAKGTEGNMVSPDYMWNNPKQSSVFVKFDGTDKRKKGENVSIKSLEKIVPSVASPKEVDSNE